MYTLYYFVLVLNYNKWKFQWMPHEYSLAAYKNEQIRFSKHTVENNTLFSHMLAHTHTFMITNANFFSFSFLIHYSGVFLFTRKFETLFIHTLSFSILVDCSMIVWFWCAFVSMCEPLIEMSKCLQLTHFSFINLTCIIYYIIYYYYCHLLVFSSRKRNTKKVNRIL